MDEIVQLIARVAAMAAETANIADQARDIHERAGEQATASNAVHVQTLEFLEHLQKVLTDNGLAVTRTCLTLVPIAQAKGDSKAELDLMIDRFDRGLMANAFLTLNPGNSRFPVEVVGTGQLSPSGIGMAQRAG